MLRRVQYMAVLPLQVSVVKRHFINGKALLVSIFESSYFTHTVPLLTLFYTSIFCIIYSNPIYCWLCVWPKSYWSFLDWLIYFILTFHKCTLYAKKNWHMNRHIRKVGASVSIDAGLGRSIRGACVHGGGGGRDWWSTQWRRWLVVDAGSTARRRPSVRCDAR